ncbi:MAG: SDR family oxidoreductase [Acidimicrobiales bacterium]|nr:SDR family oxidoreductase [Acidimicrobiales bacterium]
MALPTPSADTTALVTGASSGIGVELARQLAARGHGVTLVARRADKLEELATELRSVGVRAEVIGADLSDRSQRAELPERVGELDLNVSILANNAGLSTFGSVASADPDAEMNMVEVNVTALVDLTTRFLPAMVQRGSGAILNVASTASFQPLPGQAGYAATKAFVLSYTRSLGGELRGTGVSATALCPGPVHTGFADAAGISADEAEGSLPSFMWETAQAVAKCGLDALEKGHPVAIPGPANRVAAMAAHLTPKQLLVPILASRHPGLKRD